MKKVELHVYKIMHNRWIFSTSKEKQYSQGVKEEINETIFETEDRLEFTTCISHKD